MYRCQMLHEFMNIIVIQSFLKSLERDLNRGIDNLSNTFHKTFGDSTLVSFRH